MATLAADDPLNALAHILHAASALGPDAWQGGPARDNAPTIQGGEPGLSRDLLDLFSLLRDRRISYVLVGGVALLRYVDGRNTEDIDLVLSADSLRAVPEIVIAHRDQDFARGSFRNLRVDLLLTSNPLFKQVHEQHVTLHRFNEIEVHCATVEGLLLLKLYALPSLYRQGDGQRIALYEADITMLLERHRPSMESLFAVLKSHVDEGALAELRRIVEEIEHRIQRIRQSSQRQ